MIEGEDERAKGVVTVKDLELGKQKSAEIEDNAEWRASSHAQFEIKKNEISETILRLLNE